MEKQTAYGLIGAGAIGERMAEAIAAHPQSRIAIVYDAQPARARALAEAIDRPVAQTLEAFWEAEMDWVYIATPPKEHEYYTKEAAKRGISVLCEKPIAHCAEAGKRMVQAVSDPIVTTAMNFPLMYSEAIRELKRRIEQQEFGAVQRIEVHLYFPEWPRSWQRNGWVGEREQGGFTREVLTHFLQVIDRLFGSLSIEYHRAKYPKDGRSSEVMLIASGVTAAGIPVLLNGLADAGQEERISFGIVGSEQSCELRNWSDLYAAEKGKPFQRVDLPTGGLSILDACHRKEGLVMLEEGLQVQRIVDELLT